MDPAANGARAKLDRWQAAKRATATDRLTRSTGHGRWPGRARSTPGARRCARRISIAPSRTPKPGRRASRSSAVLPPTPTHAPRSAAAGPARPVQPRPAHAPGRAAHPPLRPARHARHPRHDEPAGTLGLRQPDLQPPRPATLDEMAKRRRGVGTGGNLRAAVFGVNDGLVSNASLMLGVAGASEAARPSFSRARPVSSPARSPWPRGSTCR